MAKSAEAEAIAATTVDRELTEVDIEVRTPTVVLSVRVDEDTARQLHRLARRRNVRVSDVLRDAAIEYARTAGSEDESSFEVIGPDVMVVVGKHRVSRLASGRMITHDDQGWGRPLTTGLAVTG